MKFKTKTKLPWQKQSKTTVVVDFLTKYNEKQENKKKDLVFTQKQTYFNGDMYFLPLRWFLAHLTVKIVGQDLVEILLRYWCWFRFCRKRKLFMTASKYAVKKEIFPPPVVDVVTKVW